MRRSLCAGYRRLVPPFACITLATWLPVGTTDPQPDSAGQPARESLSLFRTCEELGFEMAAPNMVIEAGKQIIALPMRRTRLEIHHGSHFPVVLDRMDTEYVLKSDVTTPLTAFQITAGSVTLNLNGHTVTYGTAPSFDGKSYGVLVRARNRKDIVIANGRIIQGNGDCKGSPPGQGCNPIAGSAVSEVGGLEVIWHTADTIGMELCYSAARIHHNALEDQGTIVTDRHQGVPSITTSCASGSYIHHNLIRRSRHRGIDLGSKSSAAYNEIHLDGTRTNAFAVMVRGAKAYGIHHNKIYGRGFMPIGIGPHGAGGENGSIYANYIDIESTRAGTFEDAGSNFGGHGIRLTWGAVGVQAMCNYIVVRGGTAIPGIGDVKSVMSWGRGLWLGTFQEGRGGSPEVHDNYIEAISSDDNAYVAAIAAIPGESGDVSIHDNVVVANHTMVALADTYGSSLDRVPLFVRNRFIRHGNLETYKTIADKGYGWHTVTASFLGNSFEGGAKLTPSTVQLYFCREVSKVKIAIGTLSPDNTPRAEYYLTDDPAVISSSLEFEAFHECGKKAFVR